MRLLGRAFDPTRPRRMSRPQAERRASSAYRCPQCGTVTYGDPIICAKCGKRRTQQRD